MAALVLAVSVLCGTVAGSYQEVQASDFSAGALQYGFDLSFLESLFMGAGAGALGLDMIFKTQNDIKNFKEGNWNWGDILDSPASQGQIDSANETIERLYNNAVKDWYDKHGGSSKPTPTPAPGITPPVTVAPINPDDVEMPEDWGTMKKNAQDKGILAMGAATAYCVKEAVKGWWDELYTNEQVSSNEKNPFLYKDYVGYMKNTREYTDGKYGHMIEEDTCWFYDTDDVVPYLIDISSTWAGFPFTCFRIPTNTGYLQVYHHYYLKRLDENYVEYDYYDVSKNNYKSTNSIGSVGTTTKLIQDYSFYVPIKDKDGIILQEANSKPLGKSSMWPSTDLKDDYDNNRSPNLPELVTPTLRLPTLDEIKDLWKQGTDDEENRPTYVTNFITNHTVQPTPDPEPTEKPDAKPSPTIAVVPDPGGDKDPDPNPTPSTTPAVVPDPGGDTDPKPSGSPDPDNPDPETPTPEEEASPYKADLKDIFPFCIPFDLIHLLKVFDADAEAPVFEFPLDIEMDNPFTGEKVVDYHHVFKVDMADYEPVVKILRIFQVIFFIIALMLITRQQMIKG